MIFQKQIFSTYLPSTYAGHIGLAVDKPWWFMPKWQEDDTVELIVFVFKISLLPNYRVKYYDYIVKWFSGVACNWCVKENVQ